MTLRSNAAVGEHLVFGEFELAPAARSLWHSGDPVKLGSRAFDILITLASRPGEILSKDELTKLVWRGAVVDETALRVGISAARKALGDDGERYIATVPGRGYCFILDVASTNARSQSGETGKQPLRPQRLPLQIARVVGRGAVIGALAEEITRRRLLSLVGPGGIGKTTVALAVAACLRSAYDAIAFVDLSPIEGRRQLATAVASALGLNPRVRDESLEEELVSALDGERVLLVVDNCEHLVEFAAPFIEELLGRVPTVTVLATTRELLRVSGEWVHQLSPLEAPPEASILSADELRSYSAAELFEERGAFALGGYKINDIDAPYIAEICRRLDGIALAIELAAGRLPALGVQGLASSLEDCFSTLTHGRRTALPRHQTLRAALDWSYRLLSPQDQAALRCLSVFTGSFTLEDAAVVLGPFIQAAEASDHICSLLDKSLLAVSPAGGSFRYRLLDTTRAYAQGKLEDCSEDNPVRWRHAQRFLEVCRTPTPDEERQMALRHATGDIRAALDWSLVRGGDLTLGVDLASAATSVFLRLCLLGQHRKYLDLALAHVAASASSSEKALRSELALRIAVAQAEYYAQGREAAPEKHLLRARGIARSLGDKACELKIIWMLYGQAGNVGNYHEALRYAELFEATAAGSTDPIIRFRCDRMLARALTDLGQHALAQQHVERALLLNRAAVPHIVVDAYEIDDWIAARAILARILWLRGYPDDASAVAEQCIAEAMQVGHVQSTCWAIAYNLCPVAIWRGDFDQAEALVDILLDQSREVFPHYHEWALLYRRFLDEARLGQAGVDRYSDPKPEIPAQADLFATFESTFAPPVSAALADEESWCAPELLRASAHRLNLSGSKNAGREVEAILLRSLELAKRQDAKAWELRSATGLASIYAQSSRGFEARALLEQVLKQFVQGQDTRDFQTAISVLSALSGESIRVSEILDNGATA